MALSGAISDRFGGWMYRMSWTAKQSIENNQSTVTVKHYLDCADTYDLYIDTRSNSCTVGTDTKNFTSPKIATSGGESILLGTTTHVVKHNADGSASVKINGNFFIKATLAGFYQTVLAAEAIVTLDTIARASQPSCITWPNHTQNVGNFGSTISIHMNSGADSFRHSVFYSFGNVELQKISDDVVNGVQWTIPTSLMDQLPNTTKGSGTITVKTYTGDGAFVGTKTCGFTATVPTTVKPSVTVTLEDITGVDDIYGSPVAGLSKIKVTPKVTTAYSSPIQAYSITIDGATYADSTVTTGFLRNAGTSKVKVKVTDGRGRSGSWSYDMDVQEYTRPQIPELTVHRTNGDYVEDDQGDHVCVTISTDVDDMGGKNTADYMLRYKKTTDTTWTVIDLSEVDHNFNLRHYAVLFEALVTSSYDVELRATDRHSTTVRATSASTAFSLMDWHNSGTGLRFGGVAELENTLQNDLSLKQTGNRYAFSTPGVAGQSGFICMARIRVIAANADTPITFVLSRRQEESTMTVHVRLSNPTATTSAVGSVRYEGSNYGAFLTPGGDELTWDLYVEKGTALDTVTIQDWWTSKAMESRVEVTFPGGLVGQVPTPYWRAGPLIAESILDCFFPVGFVLILYSHADPNTMYPGTTWVRITNRFLWACDADGEIGTLGGEKTHTLTVNELPKHSHGSVYSGNANGTKSYAWLASGGSSMAYGTVESGGGAAHNNMPPYIQVSVWRRTV